jgi:site-specific recombinase XerD
VTELVAGNTTALEVGSETLHARARQLAEHSRAAATRTAYASDMAQFRAWCATQHPPLEALPAQPMTVALYLAALADVRKPATIRRRMDSISVVHQLAGYPSPTGNSAVQAVWKGIRRTKGTAPAKKKAARTKIISALVAPLGTSLADVRDRALLLIGFAGALRRSELVALDVQDVTPDDDGLIVTIRRSKGDQEAHGDIRGLPYGSRPATCPVRAWRAWLATSNITDGAAFRAVNQHGQLGTTRLSDRAVADMIKRRAHRAGIAGDFAGHSLRAGFATEAYAHGTPELAIMRHGRWRSASVMRGYVEDGGVWNDNAAQRLGL